MAGHLCVEIPDLLAGSLKATLGRVVSWAMEDAFLLIKVRCVSLLHASEGRRIVSRNAVTGQICQYDAATLLCRVCAEHDARIIPTE